jgi:hypothetical protein
MHRRSALAVVLTVLVALLAALSVSPSAATPPGDTADTGNLYVDPPAFNEGQSVKLTANFPDGVFTVTFFKKTGPDTWTSIGTDESNAQGNAYLNGYTVNGTQDVYARITSGGPEGITETKTLTPIPPDVIAPTGPDTGNLSTDPTIITEGAKVSITANFPNGTFPVTLYKETAPNVWTSVKTVQSNSSGNAVFADYTVNGTQKVFARKANNDRTEVLTLTPTVIVPGNFPDTGDLSTTPTSLYDGRDATVKANFPSGTFGVTLFSETSPGVWTAVAQKTSNSSGDASFTYQVNGTQTLFALTSTGNRTEVDTVEPKAPNDITGGPANLGNNVLYVTTNSGTTPKSKGADYEGKAVLESGSDVSDTFDLETIAVRGNSTADKPKQPYKLKFVDKQKPFGMKSDRTWILLANYGDWTLIRSKIAWDIGQLLDGLKWTPKQTFTELFLNGKYIGSYQLTESIKIDKNRVNVDAEKGQVIEFDPHWKEDGVPGFVGKSGMNYAWKDPDEFKETDEGDEDPEGLTAEKIADMKKKIQNFETVLYGADNKKDWSKVHYSTLQPQDDWQTYLDLNSAVDYYLAREYSKDNDADFYRSNFFYTNNVDPASSDKFFMGPIWDFDRSAGAKPGGGSTTITEPTGWWIRGQGSQNHDTNSRHWFTRIAKDPRFLKALHDRWAAKRAALAPVSTTGIDNALKALGGADSIDLGKQVAANDRAVWKSSGSRYAPKSSTYNGEIAWIRDWYAKRYAWMDKELLKAPPPIPN